MRRQSHSLKRDTRLPQVALLIETSNSYARELLHGIRNYWREHRSWIIYLAEKSRGQSPPPWLQEWQGDGIIARIETERIAEAVRRTKLPTVDVSAARLVPGIPWVETNDDAIARFAVEHFLERGFRHFGYYHDERFNWSKWRRDAFIQHLSAAGHACSVFSSRTRPGSNWQQEQATLSAWIATLPKPAGVLACYDNPAVEVLEACCRIGVAVPDQVAVLGVNNDDLLCDLADPPLSSIIPNARRSGYEAAVLLDRMMSGETVPPEPHLFEPLGVATRQSTDVLAVTDPHVSKSVRLIRENACTGTRLEDILKQVPLSRRALESRFRKMLGRTPHEQLLRVKIDRIKAMLMETDLPLARIAERNGFHHVEYMTVMFQKNVGLTPSAYREQNRMIR
ncbi:MAG: XylR family transcriptional regulator [Verrucomicrobia bacterium]|nr:XylR family transcriptional regulator [Verrucomicrobiota bacterium]